MCPSSEIKEFKSSTTRGEEEEGKERKRKKKQRHVPVNTVAENTPKKRKQLVSSIWCYTVLVPTIESCITLLRFAEKTSVWKCYQTGSERIFIR